ncbi:DegT/DnrJ/EryC1/StrS aminotransferase family protein [Mesorhizobium sp.]|uniref:DegT/DnrJ/EryC1/StrS family aminotransferase n=1 Tax=Mesorhizobium sp. TaxID=1871066 RepID=UPI000FE816FD|nr:DegT/DnrJ/EryC1/StrS family aminotransferase [Mesorhizobium sp.]RWB56741.1 MAG: DegT/DnrJ/EryC1/StrS family aminotransferase [Mesorhizobium sp.]
MDFRYPVYKPYFTGKERDYVLDCIDSTWISSKGKYIGEFEGKFARYLEMPHALSVSNGTVALHLALQALGIGPGDEVLVPTLTYIASANAVTYTGAKVVFVDSDVDYWQIDINDARRRITPRTRAIMPVHLYGHACDMGAVLALAREHDLFVIEDCAEAIGTRYAGQLVGTFGHIGCFSFFGNKTITTGEGGMLVTRDSTIADRIARLKGQGLAKDREYWHDIVGYNYRMTNICAAIGSAQMEAIDEVLGRKRALAATYSEALRGLPLELHREQQGTVHSYWMVTMLLDDPYHRDPLRSHLKLAGIETRPLFHPLHQMNMYLRPGESYAVADMIAPRGVNLPSYPDLSDGDVHEIAGSIRGYFEQVKGQ